MTDTGSGVATAVETPSASSTATAATSQPSSTSTETSQPQTPPKNFRQAIDRLSDDGGPSGARPSSPDPASGSDAVADAPAAPFDPASIPADVQAKLRESWEAELGPWNQLRQSVDPQEFQQAIGHMTQLAQDPVAFYRQLEQELKQSGFLSDQPETPQTPAQAAPKPFAMPDADLVAEDGTKAYSAERLAEIVNGLQSQIDAKLAEKFAPIEAEQAQRELEAVQTQQREQAKSLIDTARKEWEGFTELEPQIKSLMLKDRRYSLEGAYFKTFKESYLPSLKQRERTAYTQELAKKAEATTTRPAGSVSRGGATPVKSFRDAIERNGGAQVAEQLFG